MIWLYLFIATIAVVIGAAIAMISREHISLFSAIFGFISGTVLGTLFLLVAHLYEEYGLSSLLVMAVGFLVILLVDRLTHHPTPLLKNRLWVADLTLIGLSIHALTDGFNLVVATKDPDLGTGLAFAILAHRIPIATVLTLAFLRTYSMKAALWRLAPLMLAPPIGALIGERLLSGAFGELTEYLTAFAAGTLLHVLIDNFRDYFPGHTGRFGRLAGGVAFAVGLVVILFVTYNLDPSHTH